MAETEPVLTADDLRARFGADIFVTLPDGGRWHCRRPDLKTLIVEALVPLPLLQEVVAALVDEQGQMKTDVQLAEENDPAVREFMALWVCHAAKSPRIVRTDAEAGPDAICLTDVPLPVRAAILVQTAPPASRRAPADAGFPARTDGSTAARDGEGIRDATVDAPPGVGPA